MRMRVRQVVKVAAAIQPTSGGFVAVASTGAVDRDGEVLQPGCFNPLPASVPCHSGHRFDPDQLIGRGVPRYEGRVLMIDVQFASTPYAQELRTLVQEGVLRHMSVVFRVLKRELVDGIPTVTAAELLAVDLVTVPSNPEAEVLAVRAMSSATAEARAVAVAATAALEIASARVLLAEAATWKNTTPGTSREWAERQIGRVR